MELSGRPRASPLPTETGRAEGGAGPLIGGGLWGCGQRQEEEPLTVNFQQKFGGLLPKGSVLVQLINQPVGTLPRKIRIAATTQENLKV